MNQTVQFKREAIELSWTANAYLNCGERLCKELIEDKLDGSPHHCRVVLHLAFQALELWFKAALTALQVRHPYTHDLEKLRMLYETSLPELPLPIPSYFETLLPQSLDLFSDAPAPKLEEHFLGLRYVSDRRGRLYPKLSTIHLKVLARDLERLSWQALKVQTKIWFKCGWLKIESEAELARIYARPYPSDP